MHEVLFNRLGGLSLPRKSVVRLTDRPYMTLDVYRGRKTTIQQFLLSLRLIGGFSIARHSSSVPVLSKCSNIFFSETTRPVEAIFHVEPIWDRGAKTCLWGLGHLTLMVIIEKTLKNSSSPISISKRPMALKLGMYL